MADRPKKIFFFNFPNKSKWTPNIFFTHAIAMENLRVQWITGIFTPPFFLFSWTYILIPCKYQGHGTIIGWDMRTKPKKFDEKLKPQGKFLCKFWLCFLPSLTAKQPKNGYENGHEKCHEKCHENRHQFLTLKSDQNFCKKFFHEKMFFHDFLTKKNFFNFLVRF